jgi:hypothetical protein
VFFFYPFHFFYFLCKLFSFYLSIFGNFIYIFLFYLNLFISTLFHLIGFFKCLFLIVYLKYIIHPSHVYLESLVQHTLSFVENCTLEFNLKIKNKFEPNTILDNATKLK